jgi:hypothetical protein
MSKSIEKWDKEKLLPRLVLPVLVLLREILRLVAHLPIMFELLITPSLVSEGAGVLLQEVRYIKL